MVEETIDTVLVRILDCSLPHHDHVTVVDAASSNNDHKLPMRSMKAKLKLIAYLLKDLGISECQSYFQKILKALQASQDDPTRKNQAIEFLAMEGRFFDRLYPQDQTTLLLSLHHFQNLQELELWSMNRLSLRTLCQGIAKIPSLSRLGLGGVKLYHFANCHDCLAQHPGLKSVFLSHFSFREDLAESDVANENDVATNSMILLDSFLVALGSCLSLERLEIYQSQEPPTTQLWSDIGMVGLARSKTLKSLTLRQINLSLQSFQGFALNLTDEMPLQMLDLSVNNLGNDEGDSWQTSFLAPIVKHRHIKTLSLRQNGLSARSCKALCTALMSTSRTEIDDSTNSDKDKKPQPPSLEGLVLSDNPLGDQGATALADLLRPASTVRLKHLGLKVTGLTDVGCVYLAHALAGNTSLQSLTLFGNHMTDASYVAFGETLRMYKETSQLKDLNIHTEPRNISRTGCKALLDMVKENYTIMNLTTPLRMRRPRGYHGEYGSDIEVFIALNNAGRKKLFRAGLADDNLPTKRDWIDAIDSVQPYFNAVVYLVRANPSICCR